MLSDDVITELLSRYGYLDFYSSLFVFSINVRAGLVAAWTSSLPRSLTVIGFGHEAADPVVVVVILHFISSVYFILVGTNLMLLDKSRKFGVSELWLRWFARGIMYDTYVRAGSCSLVYYPITSMVTGTIP